MRRVLRSEAMQSATNPSTVAKSGAGTDITENGRSERTSEPQPGAVPVCLRGLEAHALVDRSFHVGYAVTWRGMTASGRDSPSRSLPSSFSISVIISPTSLHSTRRGGQPHAPLAVLSLRGLRRRSAGCVLQRSCRLVPQRGDSRTDELYRSDDRERDDRECNRVLGQVLALLVAHQLLHDGKHALLLSGVSPTLTVAGLPHLRHHIPCCRFAIGCQKLAVRVRQTASRTAKLRARSMRRLYRHPGVRGLEQLRCPLPVRVSCAPSPTDGTLFRT